MTARSRLTNDRFTYLVRTSGNRVSSPAEVKIIVDEPPPRLEVPGRIEFDPIMAGESQTRELEIANTGGGVLDGRLTVSAPWRLSTSNYRVASGETARIAVAFRPEGRARFCRADHPGRERRLAAITSSFREVRLRRSLSSRPNSASSLPREKRRRGPASFSLTNRTDRPLTLKFSSDRKIRPIADVTLAPSEEKAIPVVIAAERRHPGGRDDHGPRGRIPCAAASGGGGAA